MMRGCAAILYRIMVHLIRLAYARTKLNTAHESSKVVRDYFSTVLLKKVFSSRGVDDVHISSVEI